MIYRLIKIFAIGLIISFTVSCSKVNHSANPNILLIIADDMGLDASPCYNATGAQKPSMPNLEALCANGLVFNNFWTYPVCSPTRASILTGKYGYRTGVLGVEGNHQVPLSETSIQQYLDNNAPVDYQNAVIGKWHLSGPTNGGADNPGLMGVSYYAGLIAGAVQSYWDWPLTVDGSSTQSAEYTTSAFTDLSINWLSQQSEPWFLWLAYNAPHTPFHLPPNDLHERDNLPTDTNSINADPLPYYFAMLEALDAEMGRLLNTLSTEERANTVIIFIGDNGTDANVLQSPYQRFQAKGSLYQGGINSPMIVSGYGVNRTGTEDALTGSADLFATIAELAGCDIDSLHDSKSFKRLLSDASADTRDYVYSEIASDRITGWTIRDKQYKLIQFEDGSERMFDLQNDPYENNNLLSGNVDSTILQARQSLVLQLVSIRN